MMWFIPFGDGGSFTGEVAGVSVRIPLALGVDVAGSLTVRSSGCNSQVQSLRVELSGSWLTWFYNMFVNDWVGPMRGDIERDICNQARAVIDGSAHRELSTLPVQARR